MLALEALGEDNLAERCRDVMDRLWRSLPDAEHTMLNEASTPASGPLDLRVGRFKLTLCPVCLLPMDHRPIEEHLCHLRPSPVMLFVEWSVCTKCQERKARAALETNT